MIDIDLHAIYAQYCVTKIHEHRRIKRKMLKEISKLNDSGEEKITKLDYRTSSNYERPYAVFFAEVIHPYMKAITKKMQYNKYTIENIWYQQYETGDTHKWHTHPKSMFSSVYFLELNDSRCATEFYDPTSNEIIVNDFIQEGDLIVFPTSIQHRSPVNNFGGRKTIIAFNLDFA